MTHTPTPWKIEEAFNIYIVADDLPICEMKNLGYDEVKSNAEFILYAVNNIERITKERDQLLETLKICKSLISLTYGGASAPLPPIKTYLLTITPEFYSKLQETIESVEAK